MITHDLRQGTTEWHAYRASHDNASDAPAMMGCSPYKTRDQLIAERATGIVPEVDPATQRLFDSGHHFEALARPLAEEIIGEDLYPVTGSEGRLSASFDGLTMLENVAWEHKRLNARLRAAMVEGCTGADLPLEYQVQMEQQCAVSGCERVLFTASEWDAEGDLIDVRHCWYTPNPELRARILAGWEQFERDVAAWVPPEAKPTPVVGKTPENLPALLIQVTGAVTASNLPEYKAHALQVIGSINRELTTDQDFATAESAVKWCADVESRLAAAKEHALSQTATIDELFRTIDDISAEARRTRLELDKLVKARKEEIRGEIVAGGIASLRKHIAELNAAMPAAYMPQVPADFAGAVKGKRTLDSLRDAVNTELARAKIEASNIANRIHANVKAIEAAGAPDLFQFDITGLVLKNQDDLAAIISLRLAQAEKRKEAERERIRAEEQAKLQRDAEAKDRADALAAAQAELATAKQSPEGQELSPAAQELYAQEGAANFAHVHRGIAAPAVEQNQAPALIQQAQSATETVASQAANVVPMRAAPAPAERTGMPTLKLGQIGERLGFSLTADFLKGLGFEVAARERGACLYHEADFPLILAALVRHIEGVQAKAAA